MEKQRDIYRKLIITSFKKNFESARFVEKRNDMMDKSEFEMIRDEIEDDYFIKNRGIVPYIKAMKYLIAKIETCTAGGRLFSALDDFICAKEHIVITNIDKCKNRLVNQ